MAEPSKIVPIDAARTAPSRTRVVSAKTTSGDVKRIEAQTTGSGGDGFGEWRQTVESRLAELRTDVRNLLVGGGVVVLGLVAAGWGIYTIAMGQMREVAVAQKEISGKIETLEAKLSGRIDLMEERLSAKASANVSNKQNSQN